MRDQISMYRRVVEKPKVKCYLIHIQTGLRFRDKDKNDMIFDSEEQAKGFRFYNLLDSWEVKEVE